MGYPRSIDLAAHGVHEDFSAICRGDCPHGQRPVVQHPVTGRWYITAGHPGFNLPANNRSGYASATAARAAMDRLVRKAVRS